MLSFASCLFMLHQSYVAPLPAWCPCRAFLPFLPNTAQTARNLAAHSRILTPNGDFRLGQTSEIPNAEFSSGLPTQ